MNDETDITISANLGGKVDSNEEETSHDFRSNEIESPLAEKITEFVKGLKDSSASHNRKEWDAYDIANQAFDAMQSTIARQKLAAYPPDYFIEISRSACGTLEFDLACEMIEIGYKKTQESLAGIV